MACLIPHKVAIENNKVVYLVASNLKYFNDGRTIPRLLEQLGKGGIDESRIRVVINGCMENKDKAINKVSYAFSTHTTYGNGVPYNEHHCVEMIFIIPSYGLIRYFLFRTKSKIHFQLHSFHLCISFQMSLVVQGDDHFFHFIFKK